MTGEDWSVLGFFEDPVPGDPLIVRELSTVAQRTSEMWREHANTLRDTARYGSEMPMDGDFAATYRDRLGKLPDRAVALVTAHQEACAALAQYAAQLDAAKQAAQVALRQGFQAKEEAEQAKRMLAQVQAEMASLPKVVPPEQYPYVLQVFRDLQAQANLAGELFDAAKLRWEAAQQDAVRAGEQAMQAESACAQKIRAVAPRSGAPTIVPAANIMNATSNSDRRSESGYTERPIAPRDLHGATQTSSRGVDVEHVMENGDLYYQDDGQLVRVLDNGNGTSDVVIRDPSNPSGAPTTVIKDMPNRQVQSRISSGRWQ